MPINWQEKIRFRSIAFRRQRRPTGQLGTGHVTHSDTKLVSRQGTAVLATHVASQLTGLRVTSQGLSSSDGTRSTVAFTAGARLLLPTNDRQRLLVGYQKNGPDRPEPFGRSAELLDQVTLRRRETANPASARPIRARLPGSGTASATRSSELSIASVEN